MTQRTEHQPTYTDLRYSSLKMLIEMGDFLDKSQQKAFYARIAEQLMDVEQVIDLEVGKAYPLNALSRIIQQEVEQFNQAHKLGIRVIAWDGVSRVITYYLKYIETSGKNQLFVREQLTERISSEDKKKKYGVPGKSWGTYLVINDLQSILDYLFFKNNSRLSKKY